MSNRGTILLAVGMLVLGLVLGGITGGAAGYFAGQNSTRRFTPGLSPLGAPGILPGGGTFSQLVTGGVRVMQVEPDSPAAKAALQLGDVITAVGGTKIDEKNPLADLIKKQKPGDKVELSVMRGTQTMTLTVELGASPTDATAAYLGVRYVPTAQFQGGRRFR